MSELSRMSKEELARQIRQHLNSLKSAGVDWLPKSSIPADPEGWGLKEDTASAKPQAIDKVQSNLFADVSGPEPMAGVTSSTPGLTLEQRRQELKVLIENVCQCKRCPELASTRTQTVFGVGQVGAELCFIGEAPGADEDAQGEPFVGAAGQLLDKIIAACKMKREEVYICNIIKCRPPGNRTPLPNEAANCREFLERQLELIQPKFICALGSTAAKYLLNTTQGIGQLRGRFHDYRGIPVMCTYHPAYLLPHRSPGKKKDVWEDMKMLLAKMGRPVTQSRDEG
jgi:DNA polymerase